MKIGFVGLPPQAVMDEYKGCQFIDLDEPITGIPISLSEEYLPKTFCAILKTVFANSIALNPDVIIASTGKCKCDGMRYLAVILKEHLKCPIIETENLSLNRTGSMISTSSLPLFQKMKLIVAGAIEKNRNLNLQAVPPAAGFWGVPPMDFSLLELFPDNTHVYGWSRCFENNTPADQNLELEIDENVPTVFYSQAFCQKNALANSLAKKYNGLYIECDDKLTTSTKAKLEAFIEFRVKR